MLFVYEFYGDNPIIDVLMLNRERLTPIRSIRACRPMFREPFIEVGLADDTIEVHRFSREDFPDSWAEAELMLSLLSDIRIRSDFETGTLEREEKRKREILQIREQGIRNSRELFRQGRYEEFVSCYGMECEHLPQDAAIMLHEARRRLSEKPQAGFQGSPAGK